VTRPVSICSIHLLKLFLFRCISTASFTRQSTYPDLSNTCIEVSLKSIQWPVLMLCSATADFSGWCRCMYLWCSVYLTSIVLPLCPTYTSTHTHKTCYMPKTLCSNPPLEALGICRFSFWDVNLHDIMLLQKVTNSTADVIKWYHGCICWLSVFQPWFQILL
jgi:hypothetical protein